MEHCSESLRLLKDNTCQVSELGPVQQDKDDSSVAEFYFLCTLDPVCGGQETGWRGHSRMDQGFSATELLVDDLIALTVKSRCPRKYTKINMYNLKCSYLEEDELRQCGGMNEKSPHYLRHLSTWFPAGNTVWGCL